MGHVKIPTFIAVKLVHRCENWFKLQICSNFSEFNGKFSPFMAFVSTPNILYDQEMYI